MKALAQILLCLLPIATLCTLGPFSKYKVNKLEGRWYVQSVFFSDGVDDMDTKQCSYIDFDTSKKSFINATFSAFHGYNAEYPEYDIYLPAANGSAVFVNKYANGSEKYPLEVIDTSSVQPWKDDKTFPILILLIRDYEPTYTGIFAVYAVSRRKNVPLDKKIFKGLLKALGVGKDELDNFVSMNNAKC